MIELGRLRHVDPRTVWQNEARDFTPWLLAHADYLADVLRIELELEAAEHPVGGYWLDLVGRDLTNDAVLMVENQLAETDHSHLGQVLTYAAGTSASTIVWIATSFREEHRQALDWLNQMASDEAHFFGLELELLQIGDSAPAPHFKVVSEPNEWQKRVRATARATQTSGKGATYLRFWEQYLERIKSEHPDWTRASPQAQNWLGMPCPLKGGPYYSASFAAGGRLRHELYIDYPDPDRSASTFERLYAQREMLDSVYGRPLVYEPLEGKRASRIAEYRDGADVMDEARWDEYIDWFFDAGVRLRRALEAVDLEPVVAVSAASDGDPTASPRA